MGNSYGELNRGKDNAKWYVFDGKNYVKYILQENIYTVYQLYRMMGSNFIAMSFTGHDLHEIYHLILIEACTGSIMWAIFINISMHWKRTCIFF